VDRSRVRVIDVTPVDPRSAPSRNRIDVPVDRVAELQSLVAEEIEVVVERAVAAGDEQLTIVRNPVAQNVADLLLGCAGEEARVQVRQERASGYGTPLR